MRSEPAPLDRAFALLDEGDLDGAVRLLDHAIARAEQLRAREPLAAARAHNDKGTLLRFVGDDEGALQCFERAIERTAGDEGAKREHLTYLLNAGDVLLRSGTLVEAEDFIRRSLQGRRELYGPAHPGYAFALEPLASVLLRQRKLDSALEAIEEAVANFRHHGHPRLATALVVRAEALATAGTGARLLAGAEELPDELLPALAQALEARLPDGDPRVLARVLDELVPLLEARLGPAHEATLQVWSAIANVEASGGDPEKRRAAITRVRQALDDAGDAYGALEACLGLALAFADEGDVARATEAYDDAERRAARLEDPAALAQVLRNRGVFLEDNGDVEGALRALEAAVREAARTGDETFEGRCQAALGVALAHEGRDDAARVLEAAVRALPEDHSDALVARAHLAALATGRACGCGEVDVALAQALRELVQGRLPPGLVGDVGLVTGDDDELSVDVQLLREASPREQELLDEVVRAAHRRLRERVLRGG